MYSLLGRSHVDWMNRGEGGGEASRFTPSSPAPRRIPCATHSFVLRPETVKRNGHGEFSPFFPRSAAEPERDRHPFPLCRRGWWYTPSCSCRSNREWPDVAPLIQSLPHLATRCHALLNSSVFRNFVFFFLTWYFYFTFDRSLP